MKNFNPFSTTILTSRSSGFVGKVQRDNNKAEIKATVTEKSEKINKKIREVFYKWK
jgi:threonyl-tRNA synthetase